MPNIEDLVPTLIALPGDQYAELIRRVDEQRRRSAECKTAPAVPQCGMSQVDFAHWIAHQHYAIDQRISRIFYLPTDAPEKEIRLLEVNTLVRLAENETAGTIDFMPDIKGLDYTLLVADATPSQYDAIIRGELALPSGWCLQGAQEIRMDGAVNT